MTKPWTYLSLKAVFQYMDGNKRLVFLLIQYQAVVLLARRGLYWKIRQINVKFELGTQPSFFSTVATVVRLSAAFPRLYALHCCGSFHISSIFYIFRKIPFQTGTKFPLSSTSVCRMLSAVEPAMPDFRKRKNCSQRCLLQGGVVSKSQRIKKVETKKMGIKKVEKTKKSGIKITKNQNNFGRQKTCSRGNFESSQFKCDPRQSENQYEELGFWKRRPRKGVSFYQQI